MIFGDGSVDDRACPPRTLSDFRALLLRNSRASRANQERGYAELVSHVRHMTALSSSRSRALWSLESLRRPHARSTFSHRPTAKSQLRCGPWTAEASITKSRLRAFPRPPSAHSKPSLDPQPRRVAWWEESGRRWAPVNTCWAAERDRVGCNDIPNRGTYNRSHRGLLLVVRAACSPSRTIALGASALPP